MKENKIDKLFRDKLAKGDFAYKEAYWQHVEKALPTGKVAAASWFTGKYLLGALLALASAGTITWWLITDSGTPAITIEDQPGTNQPEQTDHYEPNHIAPNGIVSEDEITTTEEGKSANEALEQHAIATTKNAVNTRNDEETATSGIKTDAGINSAVNTATSEKVTNQTAISAGNETTPYLIEEENMAAKASAISAAASNPPLNSESNNTSNQAAETTTVEKQSSLFASRKTPTITNPTFKNDIESSNKPAIIRPQQTLKKWQTSVGLEYSYLFINRSLSTSNADLENYVTFRNQFENPNSANSLGLSLQFERRGWLFNTGVNLTQFNEEINYPTTLNVLTGIDNGSWNVKQNWSYAVDSNWVIDSIFAGHWSYDTAWSVTYDSTWASQWDSVYAEKEDPNIAQNNRITSLSYLEVPLLFGKSFGKNRLYFDIQVGGAFGILTGTSGSVYINKRVDGLLTAEMHLEQFRRFNASVLVRTGIRYSITPQIQAAFYPTLRYTLTNVFNSEAISQRYFGYGLTLGLRYQF